MTEYQSVKTRLLPFLKFARPYLGLTKLSAGLCQSLFLNESWVASYLKFWLPVILYLQPSMKALI